MYFQFLLLDLWLIRRLIEEGYTHAVMQEYIPAASINRPGSRDLITFRAIHRDQAVPDGAIPLTAQCFASGLQKDEKDYYLIFDAVQAPLPEGS